MSDEPFTPQWRAFTREAAIAGQSIGAGLAALRKANYAATGLYSHAFFSLTIGLERMLKIIFLIDSATQNGGVYPSESDLRRRFGHDIQKLFSYAREVHQRLPGQDNRYSFSAGGIEDEILRFLSEFGKTTRYYNLDFLVNSNSASLSVDPIAEWFNKIGSRILEVHYSKSLTEKELSDLNRL